MKKQTQSGEALYIDSCTKEAFTEAGGGNYISRQELAALGQVSRSAEGCDIFQSLTGMQINSKANMAILFKSAAEGRINLRKILESPLLKKYVKRECTLAFD
ncbi:hypothetical protein A2272_01595 [Candidatus Peregrinibacteria bacterium RIFOXYA12_FULL_33_12]|nr:MAG: hypothetical protein A2263_05135 [Candidatus Peregrinibacteria bacterium RIFOXYA2_FULL_33_21]OGJ46346.1 MAG: hypothetical protein A2272_01595 [Candidatus Peregrinibacteria bacterium RIFOXYA12_FULL_33_12]OGJ50913.1 MAG: hypothetical protein A2307_01560 [Candidatus Peregrinibacteria bacterium RIFOXYB2_FULL_33_20]